MDGVYKEIYRNIWRNMQSGSLGSVEQYPDEISLRAMDVAINAINGALDDDVVQIRDDAKVFLLSSFYFVVVLPQVIRIISESSPSKFPGIEGRRIDNALLKLEEDVFLDTRRIIQEAVHERIGGDDLSSASVIRALPKVLDKLRLKDANIWAKE